MHYANTKECKSYLWAQKEATVLILYYMIHHSVLRRRAGDFVSAQNRRQICVKTELRPFPVRLSPFSRLTLPTFLLLVDQYDVGKSVQEGGSRTLICNELQRSAEAVPVSA